MEIQRFDLHSQRNAGHFQFLTDFSVMVQKYTAAALDIVEEYAAFQPLLEKESLAMVAITKSATTPELDQANKLRDKTFRGLVELQKSMLKHFDANLNEAAARCKIVFDSYGNLTTKPDDEKSALYNSFIADLRAKVESEMTTLGHVAWVNELERQNKAFVALQAARNSEEANRTVVRMKEIRLLNEEAYFKIIKRINAIITVNGDANYLDFVKELNARIIRAQESKAMSKGRNAASATKE